MKQPLHYFKLIVAIILGLFINITLSTGQEGPPRHHPLPSIQQVESMMDELSQLLSFTESQMEEVTKLHKEHFKLVKELEEKNRQEHEKGMENMHALKSTLNYGMSSVLTEEQFIKYEQFIKKQRPPKRKPGSHGKR